MKFQNQNDLEAVQAVIDDADKALNDNSRKMKDSPIGEVLQELLVLG